MIIAAVMIIQAFVFIEVGIAKLHAVEILRGQVHESNLWDDPVGTTDASITIRFP